MTRCAYLVGMCAAEILHELLVKVEEALKRSNPWTFDNDTLPNVPFGDFEMLKGGKNIREESGVGAHM